MKPLLKWVGGKTQLLNDLLTRFPTKIDNYYEPFVGGGSVLLGILTSEAIMITGEITVSDLNENLINFYNTIKDKSNEFILEWNQLITEYKELENKEIYYYQIRKRYNEINDNNNEINDNIKSAVYFLFLNKTCFRGLYRIGPNGFNVPYGHYKTVPNITEKQILEFSKWISNVNFVVLDFSYLIDKQFDKDDFVYFDPPYVPENKKSFVKYQKNGFNLENHQQLFDLCRSLPCKFVLSNSDTKLVRDSFSDFKLTTIEARRAINSKNPGSKTNELIISNF